MAVTGPVVTVVTVAAAGMLRLLCMLWVEGLEDTGAAMGSVVAVEAWD